MLLRRAIISGRSLRAFSLFSGIVSSGKRPEERTGTGHVRMGGHAQNPEWPGRLACVNHHGPVVFLRAERPDSVYTFRKYHRTTRFAPFSFSNRGNLRYSLTFHSKRAVCKKLLEFSEICQKAVEID